MSNVIPQYLQDRNIAVVRNPFSIGVNGWVFDVPTDQEITLESDITDHVTEDNSFIQDHIVRKPERVTLSGFIGELAFVLAEAREQSALVGEDITSSLGSLSDINQALEQVDAYLGSFTPQAVQDAQQVVSVVDAVTSRIQQQVDRARNLVGVINGQAGVPSLPPIPGGTPAPINRQTKAFFDLKALWKLNAPLTVNTPWEFFDSMLIESVSAVQEADTGFWTEISITLKQFRVAEVNVVEIEDIDAPANQFQSVEPVDRGNIQTENVDRDPLRDTAPGRLLEQGLGLQ